MEKRLYIYLYIILICIAGTIGLFIGLLLYGSSKYLVAFLPIFDGLIFITIIEILHLIKFKNLIGG